MTHDDRSEFEATKRASALSMRADEDLDAAALAVNAAADRHDWSYQWDWLGLPVIQMPADIVTMQEVLWSCRPDLVIETGVARGGSVVLSASILELVGEGNVLGVDIEIRPHNRAAIESHPLSKRIELIEGSSIDPGIVAEVTRRAGAAERVMVVLDSNHTHEHVLAELDAYAPLVTVGQFLVVADTVIEQFPVQNHRPGRPWGPGDNPATTLRAWLATRDDFVPDEFVNAKLLVSASQGGYLRRVR